MSPNSILRQQAAAELGLHAPRDFTRSYGAHAAPGRALERVFGQRQSSGLDTKAACRQQATVAQGSLYQSSIRQQ